MGMLTRSKRMNERSGRELQQRSLRSQWVVLDGTKREISNKHSTPEAVAGSGLFLIPPRTLAAQSNDWVPIASNAEVRKRASFHVGKFAARSNWKRATWLVGTGWAVYMLCV